MLLCARTDRSRSPRSCQGRALAKRRLRHAPETYSSIQATATDAAGCTKAERSGGVESGLSRVPLRVSGEPERQPASGLYVGDEAGADENAVRGFRFPREGGKVVT